MINVPAYACPTLRLGRTYHTSSSGAGIDIFPGGMTTAKRNINWFSFKYRVVKSSKDVRDMMNVSGELSLKVKAGLVQVRGSGEYLNDQSSKQGTTEVLAIMRCTTVNDSLDASAEPTERAKSGEFFEGLGTHYVRSVTYGAEIVASLQLKTSSTSNKFNIKGEAEGKINAKAVDVSLKAQLEKLTQDCSDESDLAIKYYGTDLPDQIPTGLDALVKLIVEFPSRLEKINDGYGVPIQFELLPIEYILPKAKKRDVTGDLNAATVQEMEDNFDDLRNAESLVNSYVDRVGVVDDDVKDFSQEIHRVLRKFRDAIPSMSAVQGKKVVDDCLKAYRDAIDKRDMKEKFGRRWKEILKLKAPLPPSTKLKLLDGKPLTIVLLGKTGNGKSATGNSICGDNTFEESDSPESETQRCESRKRTSERQIHVIDTPGTMDTSVVKKMTGVRSWLPMYREDQQRILTELARMFVLAPKGFDAIILVVKYGFRFTAEDGQALKLLQSFLGENANDYIILILTHGDQAQRIARKKKVQVEEYVKQWMKEMPDWVQEFVARIADRVILFNNALEEKENPEAYKKQLNKLIEVIDVMEKGKDPFISDLNERIEKAIDTSIITGELETLESEISDLQKRLKDESNPKKKKALEQQLEAKLDEVREIQDSLTKKYTEAMKKESGGCFPGSATFIDKHGGRTNMDSLQFGQEVQVITREGIRFEPVITFIHRQADVIQEYLKFTTMKNKTLKITEDHLLFVKVKGQATAVPAREVNIGDTVYVRVKDVMEEDTVKSISSIFETGVYAPVTLSGTILVDDVLASCYFDILSHKWSHMAMGIARSLYYMSPWVVQWISSIGQENGFPGWCRLAHKMLTWAN